MRITTHIVMGLLAILALSMRVSAQDTPTPTPTPIPQPTTAPQATPNLDALTDTVIAYFEVSNQLPQTGKSFTIDFLIRVPAGIELVELPTFPAEWGDWEVQNVGEMQTEALPNGVTIYRQTLTMRLWQPRDYTTPEIFIGYRLSGFNQTQHVPAQSAQIRVPTVLDFNDLTLRPFKPLIDLPYTSPLMYMIGIAAIFGLVSIGYLRWKRRPVKVTPEPLSLSPAETALASLDALKNQTNLSSAERYIGISDVLRGYIQAQFDIGMSETSETIILLRDQLAEKSLTDLSRILTEADLVKFAGVQPDDSVTMRLIDFARRWITNVNTGT